MPIDMQDLCPLLAVYDMPTSLRFYCDLLGFEIHQSSDTEPDGHIDWVWLRRNDANLMLNTMFERSNRPPQLDPFASAPTATHKCTSAARTWTPPQSTESRRRRCQRPHGSALRHEATLLPRPRQLRALPAMARVTAAEQSSVGSRGIHAPEIRVHRSRPSGPGHFTFNPGPRN
jgi:catechol 2,3-dioxygenase-like lactoylglutathione lyase family enzyme